MIQNGPFAGLSGDQLLVVDGKMTLTDRSQMVGVGQTTGIPKEYTYQPSQLGMENIKTFTEMPTAIARLKDSIPICRQGRCCSRAAALISAQAHEHRGIIDCPTMIGLRISLLMLLSSVFAGIHRRLVTQRFRPADLVGTLPYERSIDTTFSGFGTACRSKVLKP